MGAYLSQPITDKEVEDGSDRDSGLRWGAAGMQGWRTGMEDSHFVSLDVHGCSQGTTSGGTKGSVTESAAGTSVSASGAPSDPDASADGQRENDGSVEKVVAFAVFDGHGGAEVAKYCSAHICRVLRETPAFKAGDVGLGLKQTFLRMDDLLRTPGGQTELDKLRKESRTGGSDSDEEEVVDMDALTKMNPDTHMQIMEQMKKALREQFQSQGTVSGGLGADVDGSDSSDHDDDSRYSSSDDSEGEDSEEAQPEATDAETTAKGSGEDADETGEAIEGAQAKAGAAAEDSGSVDAIENVTSTLALANGTAPDAVLSPPPPPDAGGDKDHGTGDTDVQWTDAAQKLESDEAEDTGSGRRCGFDCGATAVMGVLVGGNKLVVANAGDSRCVVSRKGAVVELSTDHKPEDAPELARIEKAGGAVVDGRVQGNLNLSRAIGDLMYKADESLPPEEQMITADPELRTLELNADDEFVVLACDGVWNSLSSQETIDFVRERLRGSSAGPAPLPLSSVCADLCDACCAETADGDGTGLDNVTAVVIQLSTPAAAALTSMEAEGATSTPPGDGDMDLSDDGKRKQDRGSEDGAAGRSGKHMRAAAAAGTENSPRNSDAAPAVTGN